MYFLLKMGIFHCYVSLPEGKVPGDHGRLNEASFHALDSIHMGQRFFLMTLTDIADSFKGHINKIWYPPAN